MSGSYETLTVALATPLHEGKSSVGTGVPVAPGLVLTARHVVCHAKAIAAPVRVRFWHASENEFRPDDVSGRTGFLDAIATPDLGEDGARGIVWSCEDLDLALVAVPHPQSVQTARLSRTEPFDDANWRAEGFPNSVWEHGVPAPVRLTGTSHTRFPGKLRFQVDARIAMVERTDSNVQEGWSGASGAGLFVNGQLFGVLLTRKPNSEAKILEAVPIVDCFSNAAFCAAIGFQPADAAAAIDTLAQSVSEVAPLPKARLARALGLSDAASSDALARTLADRSLHEGLRVLAAMRDGTDALGPGILGRLALHYTACRTTPADLELLRSAAFGTEPSFDDCVAGSRMGAEFLMAAAESRAPHFKRNRDSAIAPLEGSYALPQLPENGCGQDPATLSRDLEARVGADLLGLDDWLETSMGSEFEFPLNSRESIETRREILQDELAYRSNLETPEPSYYMAEPDPGEQKPVERAALRERLTAIRQTYPELGLVFIKLDRAREERRRFRPLLDLIPKEVAHDG